MRARVEHGFYRAIFLSNHQDVVAAHHRLEEITGLWNLGLVTEEQPGACEDPLCLEFKDRRVAVNAAVDFASFERNQIVNLSGNIHAEPSLRLRASGGRLNFEPAANWF